MSISGELLVLSQSQRGNEVRSVQGQANCTAVHCERAIGCNNYVNWASAERTGGTPY